MAWLDDNPPVRTQFRCPRRADPSGVIVVHTAESTPDFTPPDGGAEAVANFIRNRTDPGSYHDICDSDSIINLVRYECEAFHDGTGTNPHSYGVSGATRADLWPSTPLDWRVRCVNNMAFAAANYARWLSARRGIIVPARRITRDESELGIPGFISHAERDPVRRTDPGAGFPWDAFLAEFARLTKTPQEDDMPRRSNPLIQATGVDGAPANAIFVTDGNLVSYTWVPPGPDGVPPDQTTLEHIKYFLRQNGESDALQRVDDVRTFGSLVGPEPPGWPEEWRSCPPTPA